MPKEERDRPPRDISSLAAWFAEGVRSELAALEKNGGSQDYEVLSGRLLETTGEAKGIFLFILADGTRVPEDASGRLKTEAGDYAASVISQKANKIQVQIEGGAPLPHTITRGILTIDDTALLKRLADALEAVSADPSGTSSLAATLFHPDQAKVSFKNLQDYGQLSLITGELRSVLEQACGSSLTYIWGPPGTGKTYAIARLITALLENGERILITSHTNAAIDQVIYATINPDNENAGPMFDHPLIEDGKILRIGRTTDTKVPDNIRLEKVLESRAKDFQLQISSLETQALPLAEKRAGCRAKISHWQRLTELTEHLERICEAFRLVKSKHAQAKKTFDEANILLIRKRRQFSKALISWFRRNAKIKRATKNMRNAEAILREHKESLASTKVESEKAQSLAHQLQMALEEQSTICKGLPNLKDLEVEVEELSAELTLIENQIQNLQDEISSLQQKLINEARVIFCTLTKNYVGNEIEGQSFDAVIADEISMALPPLLFLAAGRAAQRTILVGDFWQLPPIVRSDSEISNARLREDAFHLAGVARELKAVDACPVLARLTTQHRMLPPIADVARHIAYGLNGIRDHEDVLKRQAPEWCDFLPPSPLLIIDTADLHCWSGKQPGSLSRFNFYSATVAAELAALLASSISKPAPESSPPIGIVTPYAAQRRFLTKLITEMQLGEWVTPGTIHTFQGGQADVIIFDSVLDEPYWAARLCTPMSCNDVKRDLNVAVTRAKSKFIFIGSSEWLNKHAKPASGLGQMWAFLKDRADLISATELVELQFYKHLPQESLAPTGWIMPLIDEEPTHEILDETTFFARFAADIDAASKSVFGLVPYFGEYRWPTIQPVLRSAIERAVEVTLVTPPISESGSNKQYVEKAIRNLRDLGAVVISATGLHGKDIIIDECIHYTGSLNWASHRGRSEVMHRTKSPVLAKLVLQFMQAKYIRGAAVHEDGSPRTCPLCGWPTRVVNQKHQHRKWDYQAMKIGCTNPNCKGYLRDIDERPPFKAKPKCAIDGNTKYRRVRRGRGEIWQCPKHPKKCPTEKVVPGDPS